MVTITQSAEFMTNLVSANPIPAGYRFFAFNDEHLHPAVLSHSEDHKLNLVLEVDGVPQLFDFGDICKLSGKIQAVALAQDSDLNIWAAVATDSGDGFSDLYLIVNLRPNELLDPPAANIIKASNRYPQIHGLHMSNFTRDVGGLLFPLLFVAFQPLDKITKEDQLGYVEISVDSNSKTKISLNTSWKLATDTLRILDVTFGQCLLGKGAFVLYETAGNALKLQFRVFDSRDFSVDLNAPPGARCLTGYYDDTTEYTTFLVGGDVITQYKYADYNKSTGKGTTIIGSSDSPLGIKDIHTAQSGNAVTVWYTTGSDAAYYYSASTSSMGNGRLVQLLRDGAGGQISGLLSSKNKDNLLVNTLLSVNESGDLTILQQASDTGMWESHPFFIPATTENLEIPSFTIRIQAHPDTVAPQGNTLGCQLHLTASGFVRVQSNGRTAVLDRNGAWYQADHTGTVTIIIATTDISCCTLQVDKFKAPKHDEIPLNVPVLAPSSKLNHKLAQIKDGKDLLDATTQSGKKLIEPGTVPLEEANEVASMIKALSEEHRIMTQPENISRPGTQRPTSSSRREGEIVHIAGKLSDDPNIVWVTTGDSSGSPWDYFLYLFEKAKDIASWALRRVGDALELVVHWAGQAFAFICDSVMAIGKAISWAFAKVKVAVKELLDYLGFLFNWKDILRFSDSIVTFLNVSFEYGKDQIGTLEEKAKSFADDVRTELKKKIQPPSIPISKTHKDPNDTDAMHDVRQSVAYNWSNYQLDHGGFQKDASVPLPRSADQDPLEGIWTDFMNEVKVISDLVKNLAEGVCSLFDGNTSSSELYAKFANDTIDALCDTFKNIVGMFLKGVVLVMKSFNDLGNRTIEIPLFSGLWKSIAGGRKFTFFNFIALIMSIPATVIYKLIKDKAPPTFEGRLTKDALGKFLRGDDSLDSTLANDIRTFRSILATAGGLVLFGVTSLTFAIDSVAGGIAGKRLTGGSLQKGLEDTEVSAGPVAGNIIDTVTLLLTGAGLYFTWPLNHGHDVTLRWWVWGLGLSNGAFLAISRLVGWATGIPRVETKRFVGVFEVATGWPTLILELIIAAHEYKLPDDDKQKDDARTTRDVVKSSFEMVSRQGFCVAALMDEVQPELMVLGLAVFGLSLTLKYSVSFVGLMLENSK
ncbi:hypothetical protein CPB86DRAFT_878560 [Serendipita vermifera]|nr:hypothetical protein CPB86DRAFT_878560 [Serendipita vermifera]